MNEKNFNLEEDGFTITNTSFDATALEALRNGIFISGEAGTRCLLDNSLVRDVAINLQ